MKNLVRRTLNEEERIHTLINFFFSSQKRKTTFIRPMEHFLFFEILTEESYLRNNKGATILFTFLSRRCIFEVIPRHDGFDRCSNSEAEPPAQSHTSDIIRRCSCEQRCSLLAQPHSQSSSHHHHQHCRRTLDDETE